MLPFRIGESPMRHWRFPIAGRGVDRIVGDPPVGVSLKVRRTRVGQTVPETRRIRAEGREMRITPNEMNNIAGYRYGFMIADMVLGDTLNEFADGSIEEDELAVAIQQHRIAYEGYVRKLHEYLKPVAEA